MIKWAYNNLEKTVDAAEEGKEPTILIEGELSSLAFIKIKDIPSLIKELQNKETEYREALKNRKENMNFGKENEILESLFQQYSYSGNFKDFKDSYHYMETEGALRELFAKHGIRDISFEVENIEYQPAGEHLYQEDVVTFPNNDKTIKVITESYQPYPALQDFYYRYWFSNIE